MLREKWGYELKKRFGIDSLILNSKDTLKILKESKEDVNSQFAIIASIEGLRPFKGWNDKNQDDKYETQNNLLAKFLNDNEDENKLIDLLIIDEAHYLRNPETQNAKLGKLLRAISDYIVLLTATPIHLKNEDLYNLVTLVDEDVFSNPKYFDDILSANEPLVKMIDRLLHSKISLSDYNELLNKIIQNPVLNSLSQIQWLINLNPSQEELNDIKFKSYLAYKLDLINFLGNVISRNRKRDVFENRVIREPKPISIPQSKCEMEFYNSVSAKIKEYCQRYRGFEAFLLVTPQRQMSSSMPAALKYWKSKNMNFDISEEELFEDIGFNGDDLFEDHEVKPILSELIRLSESFDFDELVKNDSKFDNLSEILKKIINDNSKEKIIIFSYFRATIDYLYERLNKIGLNSIILKGGGTIDKESIILKFASNDNINILISSEIGSEGIDLQFSRIIINYDLPWNPMRIEQRIGRIDRIGQISEKISIFNLFYENTIDSRIYNKLFERLKIFEMALGLPEAILGDSIQRLTNEILITDLTPEQEEAKINQTAVALENKIIQEETLENQASNLLAYGDYIINKVNAARELNRWISEDDIFNYIKYYISSHYTGSQFIALNNNEKHTYAINLSNQAKQDLEDYIRKYKHHIHTNLHLTENKSINCVISSKIATDKLKNRYEIINQIHPLVRFVSYSISKEQNATFFPSVCAKIEKSKISSEIEEGIYLFVIQKWTIQGIQDKEKLLYFCIKSSENSVELNPETAETFILNTIKYGEDWLNPSDDIKFIEITDKINNYCLYKANILFENFKREYQLANLDRVKFQLDSLNKHYKKKKQEKEELIEKLKYEGKIKILPAQEGQLEKLKNRVERQRIEINKKANIIAQKDELSVGLISVY